MIIQRRLDLGMVLQFAVRIAGVGAAWATLVFVLYAYAGFHFLRIPSLPVATIGTAVAFYVGFKNNASYERFWEGRKIWGSIVNASRTWATYVNSYVMPGDRSDAASQLRRDLVYRQLAWINALRVQLRKTTRFHDKPTAGTKKRLEDHADGMRNDWTREVSPFLSGEEFDLVSARVNPATHILTNQGKALSELVLASKLDLFHQIAMMDLVAEFYALQGKCERIKHTPFPRIYAEYSRIFTRVFMFFVPFAMLDVFANQVDGPMGLGSVSMIVASALVAWVFGTMEGIGDATEDPFERSMNDVPMNALCRTIERDLRELLGETELPDSEPAHGIILY